MFELAEISLLEAQNQVLELLEKHDVGISSGQVYFQVNKILSWANQPKCEAMKIERYLTALRQLKALF